MWGSLTKLHCLVIYIFTTALKQQQTAQLCFRPDGFFSACVNICCSMKKENKREAPSLSQRCNFPWWWCGAHAFMVSVAEVEGNLQCLQPHFSDHSSLRGSLVTVQKNFIYFQFRSCLSEPPGLEWRTGGRGGIHSLSTTGCWQPPALLLLGIPEVSEVPSVPPESWTGKHCSIHVLVVDLDVSRPVCVLYWV